MNNDLNIKLRVTSIRSRGSFGGVIFSGITDLNKSYVVILDSKVVSDSEVVQKGQLWKVWGSLKSIKRNHGPRIMLENEIHAEKALMLQPTGENLIHFIAENPNFKNIGYVKARKLWHHFGNDLLKVLQNRDLIKLKEILSHDNSVSLLESFSSLKVAASLLYLDDFGLPNNIGQKVIEFYGESAKVKIHEDPYRLLAFGASFESVDKFALTQLNFPKNHHCRLTGVVEDSLNKFFTRGDTCATEFGFYKKLNERLQDTNLVDDAMNLGLENGLFYSLSDKIHPAGAFVMENYVADTLTSILSGAKNSQLILNNISKPKNVLLNQALKHFEEENGFRLTYEQVQAIEKVIDNNFCLITGGAGVGKTTLLKALYHVLETIEPMLKVYQLALTGKAAKRMSDSTGLSSYTIASFLNRIRPEQINNGSIIIIDESSMIDLILAYRLLRHLPSGIRLVLIGDPFQLPPIGPGLILHELVKSNLPQVNLKIIKRQNEKSGIPEVSNLIRSHNWPKLEHYENHNSGVTLLPCSVDDINKRTFDIFQSLKKMHDDVMILCPTVNGQAGAKDINEMIQHYCRFADNSVKIMHSSMDAPCVFRSLKRVQFKVNDRVIYLKNNYDKELRNGSVGTIKKVYIATSPTSVACEIDFEGVLHQINYEDLENLDLAYAISVHKSQGSQYNKIIIPVRKSRVLDQTLIYTAVTRAITQVVLIGDISAMENAVKNRSKAQNRTVGLGRILKQSLRENFNT